MKIVIIISNLELGGAQRVALNLNEWLNSQSEITSSIVALKKTTRNTYQTKIGDNVYGLEGKNILRLLRAYLKSNKPDIMLTMGVPMSIYTVPAVFGLKTKHIISERNDPEHFAGRTITKWISRFLMRFADGFVFQTEDAKSFYPNSYQRKSVIIHNPLLNTEKMPDYCYSGIREKEIVTVGRLNTQKNHSLLIEAFNRLKDLFPKYKLIIYGEGPERKKLETQVLSLGLSERVLLPGSFSDVFTRIYKSSLFILPSDFEGMPNALMEAMALGLPCISTNCPCGGPRALIQSGVNGELVEVGNIDQLVDKMIILLGNIDYCQEMGNNAFKIRQTHSMQNICMKWLDYFNKQLS